MMRSFFGQKHLNDSFALDGIQSVSARDAILREIISNSLAHRDYSNPYVAQFLIEKDSIVVKNGNRAHGMGVLNIHTFEPFSKNPAISKVFREIGYADELGSGMRNSYKYTRLYSGGEPEFIEGDVERDIRRFIGENPHITIDQMVEKTKWSKSGIRYQIDKMKKAGRFHPYLHLS